MEQNVEIEFGSSIAIGSPPGIQEHPIPSLRRQHPVSFSFRHRASHVELIETFNSLSKTLDGSLEQSPLPLHSC